MPALKTQSQDKTLFGLLSMYGACVSDNHFNNPGSGYYFPYICPQNKIAIINRFYTYNPTAGTIAAAPCVSGNNRIFRNAAVSESTVTTGSVASNLANNYILKEGEACGYYATVSGLNLYHSIIEMNSGNYVYISRNSDFSSGIHNIFTAGNKGTVFFDIGSNLHTANSVGLRILNMSNRTLNFELYVVPPGQTAVDHNRIARGSVNNMIYGGPAVPQHLSSGTALHLYLDGSGDIACSLLGVNL